MRPKCMRRRPRLANSHRVGDYPDTAVTGCPGTSTMPARMAPPFTIASVMHGGDLVVTLAGELDYHTAPQLADVLDRRVAEGQTVLIDLTALDFIDSSGMRVILLVWKRSQRDGFDLRLTRSSETVMSTFAVAGLIGELPFTEQA